MIITGQRWKLAGLTTAFLTLVTFTSESAQAITINSGNFQNLGSSGSVVEGANESNDTIFYFDEGVTDLGATGVEIDADAPGTYVSGGSSDRSPGTLTNQRVQSFYFSFDPVGGDNITITDSGTFEVTFDQKILGLIFTDSQNRGNPTFLDDSDGILGNSAFTYSNGNESFRGLELGNDSVTWSGDSTLTFDSLRAQNTGVDQIRVVTEPVPFEAETGAALVVLGSYLGWKRLRRRKQVSLSES